MKEWAIQTGISIVYSFLISILGSIAFIFIGRQFLVNKISYDVLIQINFLGLFIIFFLLSLPLAIIFQSFNIVTKYYPPKDYGIRAKLRKISLDKRQRIVVFTKRIVVSCFLIAFFLVLMLTQESLLNPAYRSPLINWVFLLFFMIYGLAIFSKFLITPKEWIRFHLENYKKTEYCKDFESALRSYNKALGSSLSLKRIIAISQYVEEAYKIADEDEIKHLDSLSDKTLNSLSIDSTSEIDDNIIALSELAKKITKEHQRTLGFEPRYPYRIILSEKLSSSTDKAFPQIVIFLTWVGILLVLARFGIVNVTFPP